MGQLDHPVGVALQEEPPRRRPLLLASVVVALLVLVAWTSVWWGRTPEVLDARFQAGLEPGPQRGPMLVGVTAPATRPGQGNVTLVDVTAVVGRNDADADVTFVVCEYAGSNPLGVVLEPVEDHCARTRPAHDTTLRVAGEYLVMVVAPSRKGVVRVDAVEVTYRNGWQLVWLPRTVTVAVSARMKVT